MRAVDLDRRPPYKTAGAFMLILLAAVLVTTWSQFRGNLVPTTKLTMMAGRAGLSMVVGSKVTYNGVQIGRVAEIAEANSADQPKARLTLAVNPKYIRLIPANVTAEIKATTVFGNKYVAFSSPKHPDTKWISPGDVIDVSSVTTELNTLFETVVAVAQKVDPVKLNQTLTATAQALDGLGDRFGRAIVDGNEILEKINSQMPQIRYDNQRLADLADIYADASPHLWDGLDDTVTTARALNEQQVNLDRALVASIGFGSAGGDIFERGGPYLLRGTADFIPTSGLLNEYSPMLFCTIRKYHDVQPKVSAASGGNGYSGVAVTQLVGAGNPYVYPDNLPRVNAHGGPEGRPGCWQDVTRDLWPAPYLVMDTGASIAPYNHFELGQPMLVDYVWGRQVGEMTINP